MSVLAKFNCLKRSRKVLVGLAVLAGIALSAQDALAQGCVASRQSVCINAPNTPDSAWAGGVFSGESWLSPRRWQMSVDYRYFHSHRHFVGTVEQTHRAEERTEVNNIVHSINVAATYEVNSRLSFTLNVPMFFSDRYRQSTPDILTEANGIGDINLTGRMWLLRNASESRQNIAFGVGVKLPTGRSNVIDTVNTPDGPVTRAVDQSIQPGDGGYGLTLEFQAYKGIKSAVAYASGLYL
ncbi:MAG TPA: hypothetical protein VFQ92_17935, partial [Blastocatellia bacterium]|nr:hypothetical protein [Blastocatellia bacterium]